MRSRISLASKPAIKWSCAIPKRSRCQSTRTRWRHGQQGHRSVKMVGAGQNRSVHVHLEVGARSVVIEIQRAEAGMEVDLGVHLVIDRTDELPVDIRANAEAADIGVSRQAPSAAEVAMIPRRKHRVGPTESIRDDRRRKQTLI